MSPRRVKAISLRVDQAGEPPPALVRAITADPAVSVT
jgi:hypothetical protein